MIVYFTLADNVADGKYSVALSYDSKNLVKVPDDGGDSVTMESTGVTVEVKSGQTLKIGEGSATEPATTEPVATEPTEAEESDSTLENATEESIKVASTDKPNDNKTDNNSSVDTGDDSYVTEMLILLFALLGCGAIVVVYRTKANRKE